jgi:hypothetical protein
MSRPEAVLDCGVAATGSAATPVDRPRVRVSRAVEPVVDVMWGHPAAGERAYEPGECTPREALALRLFVYLSERDARLVAERGDLTAEAHVALGCAAA